MAIFIGTDGNDTLNGTAENDIFDGGLGDDFIFGLGGSDLAIYDILTDGADQVNLGDGLDTVSVSNSSGTNIRLTFTSAEVGNGNANDSGALGGQDGGLAVRMQVEDGSGNLTGATSRYDDEGMTFISSDATFDVRDLVSGVQRGALFQSVQLGTSAGDIAVAATAGAAYINAGGGNDTVNGGKGDDFLVGGSGDDELSGGRGNDSFIGGLGTDRIFGGEGNDTAIYNVDTDGPDRFAMGDPGAADSGSGEDQIVVNRNAPGQVRLTFTSAEVGNGSDNDSGAMANQDGFLAVRIQAEGADGNTTGSIGRGEDEMVSYVGGAGVTFDVRDLVSGAARGDQFNVVTLGSSGNDTINENGETQNYYINGGMGNDVITGGDGDDFLVGGAGRDSLIGGDGDDSFIGGAGIDRIFGGDGNDTAIYNVSTDGNDRFAMGDPGDGEDTIIVNRTTPGQVRLTFTSAEVGNGDDNDSDSLANQDGFLAVRIRAENAAGAESGATGRAEDESVSFVAGVGVTFDVRDLVSGTARGDQFGVVTLGSSVGDVVDESGESVNYYINAGAGNDDLTGGEGNDFLVGGLANDTLSGGAGRDTLLGGLNNDTFVYTDGDFTGAIDGVNVDAIVDFTSAIDTIDLSGVDADTGTDGDQAFTFIVDAEFSGTAGELQYSTDGTFAFLQGDTDGDGVADFQIRLDNNVVVTADDFIL